MRLLLILFYSVASSLRVGIIPYKANFHGRAREKLLFVGKPSPATVYVCTVRGEKTFAGFAVVHSTVNVSS